MTLHTKYICLISFILWATLLSGQTGQMDVQNWVELLSLKKDIRAANARSIYRVLLGSDSTARCELLKDLERLGPKKNKRFQIRLFCLQGLIDASIYPCNSEQVAHQHMQHALQLAYEIDDPLLIVEVHEALSRLYFMFNDFGNSTVHALSAIEIKESLGVEHFDRAADLRYELGHILYHARDYRGAIRMSHAAIALGSPHGDSPDTLARFFLVQAWNNIGLSHTKLHEYDSAFIAYEHAYALAGTMTVEWKPEFWQGIIKGNIGDIYYQRGELDSARVLLERDYETSLKHQQYDNAANSLQWIARINLQEGNLPLALQQVQEAARLEHMMRQPNYRANIFSAYVEIFNAFKQSDSMDLYLKQYLTLHDSLEQVAFNAKAEIVNVRLDHQKSIHQILELNKEKRKILLIRNFIIVIVILFAAIGYLFFHHERLKMHLRQQQAIRDKETAEAEALLAKDQLGVFTQHMLEKTELVDALRAQLVQKEFIKESTTNDSELTQFSILTDEDWDRFRTLFEKVYPGFFQSLKRTTEGITLSEQRMAALIKLKVPAKKAAVILGISPNSVYKTRQRLRRRLGLATDPELDEYFTTKEN